jgi:hypothetical protein
MEADAELAPFFENQHNGASETNAAIERSEEVAESLQHAFAECSEKEHWWRNFCEGPDTKLVPRRAAVQAIREILIEFAGPLAAERAKIDFAGEQVTVMELRALLEDLTGGATGYRILLRKAGCV